MSKCEKDKTLLQFMIEEDMIARGYDPSNREDVNEFWADELYDKNNWALNKLASLIFTGEIKVNNPIVGAGAK